MDSNRQYTFKFLSYYFDKYTNTATFAYQGVDNFIFGEKIVFAPHPEGKKFNVTERPDLDDMVDRAMFLAFILIGTSYFKSHPTPNIELPIAIDEWQARFFNKVYQEGLSQFAFENGFLRQQLAQFKPTKQYNPDLIPQIDYHGNGVLSLQSGGKDSILTGTLLSERGINYTPWYVSSSDAETYPAVLDQLLFPKQKASVAVRTIDLKHLQASGGYNGHVPVTYITEAIALIQAILWNYRTILVSIGQEGNEPHAQIGDMYVYHQWSKTWEAEQLMAEYVRRYISTDLQIGSPLRGMSELFIAELFTQKCWERYGFQFSSCNVANYKQQTQNGKLQWCGKCAKCANTYLLFCPFLPPVQLQSLFKDNDLFADEGMWETFKGLLGVDGVMKPFECVGSYDELRTAYQNRQQGYASLPFAVPYSSFNYRATYPMQTFALEMINQPVVAEVTVDGIMDIHEARRLRGEADLEVTDKTGVDKKQSASLNSAQAREPELDDGLPVKKRSAKRSDSR